MSLTFPFPFQLAVSEERLIYKVEKLHNYMIYSTLSIRISSKRTRFRRKSGNCWEMQITKLSSNYTEIRLTKGNLPQQRLAYLFAKGEITSGTKSLVVYLEYFSRYIHFIGLTCCMLEGGVLWVCNAADGTPWQPIRGHALLVLLSRAGGVSFIIVLQTTTDKSYSFFF